MRCRRPCCNNCVSQPAPMSRQDADRSELDRVVKPGAAALLETLLLPHQGQQEGKGGPRMQVMHIEAVDPVTAQLPGSPRAAAAARPLEAHLHQPEQHRPSLPELELGEVLQPDINDQHGHPGVDCWELPPGHAHRCEQGAAVPPDPRNDFQLAPFYSSDATHGPLGLQAARLQGCRPRAAPPACRPGGACSSCAGGRASGGTFLGGVIKCLQVPVFAGQ